MTEMCSRTEVPYRSRLWETIAAQQDQRRTAVVDIGKEKHGDATVQAPRVLGDVLKQASILAWHLRQSLPLTHAASCPLHVGVVLNRSVEYVVAVLSCLSAGCAFVPIDPNWPATRLELLLGDASLAAAIVRSKHKRYSANKTVFEAHGCPVLDIDDCKSQPDAAHVSHIKDAGGRAMPYCYVMFTSGSTGRPKGVRGTEEGILNRCKWMEDRYSFEELDVVALSTSPCFVDSVWQIFGPLLAGIPIVVIPPDVIEHPSKFVELLTQAKVTHLVSIPSLLSLWTQPLRLQRDDRKLKLKMVISSGEPLSIGLCKELRASLSPGCRLLNIYGSTEVSADCTCFDVEEVSLQATRHRFVPVGTPIQKMCIAVVQNRLLLQRGEETGTLCSFRPVARGTEGEVWVGGVGVCRSYVRTDMEEGAPCDRFVEVELQELYAKVDDRSLSVCVGDGGGGLSSGDYVRFFRTGDVGIMEESGVLYITGRVDLQVKVNGVRVDLLEVEKALRQCPGVQEVAAKVFGTGFEGQALHAYVVLGKKQEERPSPPTADEDVISILVDRLKDKLPSQSIPSKFEILEKLPRGPAGKLERNSLPGPSANSEPNRHPALQQETEFQRSGSTGGSMEARVMEVFSFLLGDVDLEATSNFFLFGGTSLLMGQAAAMLNTDLRMVQAFPTVRSLARALSQDTKPQQLKEVPAPSNGSLPSGIRLEKSNSEGGGTVWTVRHRPLSSESSDDPLVKRRKVECQDEWVSVTPLRPCSGNLAERGSDGAREYLGRLENGGFSQGTISNSPNYNVRFGHSEMGSQEGAEFTKEGSGNEAVEGGPDFSVVWAGRLSACVDASTAVVSYRHPETGTHTKDGFVLACSHGGDVACFRKHDGCLFWQTRLEGRADAGLTVTRALRFIAVGTGNGSVVFLKLCDGKVAGEMDMGGDVRAAPVVDPWEGTVWCTSHGGWIAALLPPNKLLARYRCSSPISCSVSFDASSRHMYVGTLGGDLVAVRWDRREQVISPCWTYNCGGPIFGTPQVHHAEGLVVCATAKGGVACLTKSGSLKWAVQLGSPIFASPGLSRVHAFVGMQSGELAVISMMDGAISMRVDVNLGGISNAPVTLGESDHGLACLVCCNSGILLWLRFHGDEFRNATISAAASFPNEVFSNPIVVEGCITAGCRDDHVYCLKC